MAGRYAYWHDELKGIEHHHQSDLPEAIDGFWRIPAAKTKPDYPVAVWVPQGESRATLQIGGRRIIQEGSAAWDEFMAGTFVSCVAVGEEDWRTATASGYWPDGKPSRKPEPVAVATEDGGIALRSPDEVVLHPSNNPLPADELADQIAALAEVLNQTKEPVTQAEADKLTGLLDRMRAMLKTAEAERVKEKAPVIQSGKEIEARWKAITSPGATAYDDAETRRKAFLKREQARLDAEAAEERKRREAVFGEGAQLAVEPPAPRARAGTIYGRQTGLRKVSVAAIEDMTKLAEHFIKSNDADFNDYMQRRAQQAARIKIALPGVVVREELQ